MTVNQLRQAYLDFFKNQGHAVIPSSSLVPENDPTTLFTGSGMQPIVPYLLGETHPKGTRIVDSQKCFRSQDIEEAGDNRHTTYFEMLGNWSLGDYFKKEQLRWFFTFLTQEVGLDPKRLYVTVFSGNQEIDIPEDQESVSIWKELFAEYDIEAKDIRDAEKNGMQDGRIFYYDDTKNWWSRAGKPSNMPVGEPGGPDSEVFFDFGIELGFHENSEWRDQPCHVNCDCGRFLEIGNSVFMEYIRTDQGFELLPNKNVDFGGGLERILAAKNDDPDVFLTDIFELLIKKLEELSGKSYSSDDDSRASFRVVLDHARAAVMLASDGVYPSNKEQGYFARRLVRRAVRSAQQLGITEPFLAELVPLVADLYSQQYPEVAKVATQVAQVLTEEERQFSKVLAKALRKLHKDWESRQSGFPDAAAVAAHAFDYFQSEGLPVDIYLDEARSASELFPWWFGKDELDHRQDIVEAFEKLRTQHAQASREGSASKFKGGLADHSETTLKYHTATHLLQAALRQVLGDTVQQQGSNITQKRLRFDFSFDRALTSDEKERVEQLIADWVAADLPVTKQIMTKDAALASGAIAFFREKYPDEVSVYTIGTDPEGRQDLERFSTSGWVSKELCGGPHVERTGEIGAITIKKEQSASAGIRRIYMELR